LLVLDDEGALELERRNVLARKTTGVASAVPASMTGDHGDVNSRAASVVTIRGSGARSARRPGGDASSFSPVPANNGSASSSTIASGIPTSRITVSVHAAAAQQSKRERK